MNILVVAAHPDDETLGCGGTIARYADAGAAVSILILGEGVTARAADRSAGSPAALERLRQQAEAAGNTLGARRVILQGLPDNRFDTVPLLDIAKVIEKTIEEFRPDIVFTQHGGDLNIDHERTFRAVLTATRPMAGSSVRSVFAYEVPSSTEWAFQKFSPVFRPNVFVDIGGTLEKKIAACCLYTEEMRPFPHPRSPEALRAHAQYWGSTAGLGAAEAFELIRDIQRI
ncbi:MAG: PIG-L deacetylase family protein [Candidatus Peregrinibacteria bacterium]